MPNRNVRNPFGSSCHSGSKRLHDHSESATLGTCPGSRGGELQLVTGVGSLLTWRLDCVFGEGGAAVGYRSWLTADLETGLKSL